MSDCKHFGNRPGNDSVTERLAFLGVRQLAAALGRIDGLYHVENESGSKLPHSKEYTARRPQRLEDYTALLLVEGSVGPFLIYLNQKFIECLDVDQGAAIPP